MYDAYKKQLRHIFGISRKHSDLSQMARLQVVPSIFRSVMYDGCIEKGMCEEAGGTRYPQVNPIMTAGIDAANSLLAIKHLVFDTKKITMAQLMEAIKANFEGYEEHPQDCASKLQARQTTTPKWKASCSSTTVTWTRSTTSVGPDCFGHRTSSGRLLAVLPQLLRLPHGCPATGRKAGVALTDGSVSAMPGTDHEGITALIKSGAEAIDTVRYRRQPLSTSSSCPPPWKVPTVPAR